MAVVWPKKVDPETNEALGTQATTVVLEKQRRHYADISDVSDHNQVLRQKPNQKHSLCEKRKSRSGKVGILLTVQGDFANGSMCPFTAQMLVEEGGVMFTMDHDQELKYQMGLATTRNVFHYRPWLIILANEMAKAAGIPLPYVYLAGILEEDTGERLLYDCYLEQLEREQKFDEYAEGMTYCPCDICERRRRTCGCDSCTAW